MSKETEVTFEQIERETFIGNALATGGHYQAVKPNQYFKVTGNRYNGSNTPDIVRDLWSTPSELVTWMESEYGDYDIDAAASKENAVCEKFYSKETNCLKRWWGSNKHIWLNRGTTPNIGSYTSQNKPTDSLPKQTPQRLFSRFLCHLR